MREDLFGFAWILFVIAWVAGAVVQAVFVGRMKRHHPDDWKRVNSPAAQNSISRSWKVMRWTWNREYADLGDGRLTELGDWNVRLQRLFLVVFGIWTVFFFWT